MNRFFGNFLVLVVLSLGVGWAATQPLQATDFCACCYPAGDTMICGNDICCTWHRNSGVPTCSYTVTCDDGTVITKFCGSSCS